LSIVDCSFGFLFVLQSRDTGNIGHTRRSENRRGNQQWTIQRHWQHWPHKTKRKQKGQSTMDNPDSIIFVLCVQCCQCLWIVHC
jgi:hypothetical protein